MATPSYNKEKVINIVHACAEQNGFITSYSVLVSLVQFVFTPEEAGVKKAKIFGYTIYTDITTSIL